MQAVSSRADDLLTAAGRGDRDAFGVFYDRTVHLIFPLLHGNLGDLRQAGEAIERIYVRMWSAAPGFRRSECAYGLLLAAARREITEARQPS